MLIDALSSVSPHDWAFWAAFGWFALLLRFAYMIFRAPSYSETYWLIFWNIVAPTLYLFFGLGQLSGAGWWFAVAVVGVSYLIALYLVGSLLRELR